jgi:hypothetical protein
MNNNSNNSSYSIDWKEETPSMEITIVEKYNMNTRLSTTIDGSYQLHYACPTAAAAANEEETVKPAAMIVHLH